MRLYHSILLCLHLGLALGASLSERNQFDYDDDLARHKMYPLAAGSDSLTDPQICVTNRLGGTITKTSIVQCDENPEDTCMAYAGYSDSERAIFLVFRGTWGPYQLQEEFNDIMKNPQINFPTGGKVADYFGKAFLKLWNDGGLKDAFLTLSNKYPGYKLYITGHSLGGALAALGASYINTYSLFENSQIRLVTFGEPRVGDAVFAATVDKIPYAYRVVHKADMYVHMPYTNMGYIHHKTEVWYDNDMSKPDYKVCTGGDEDSTCSNSNPNNNNADDHSWYFNYDINQYAAEGCTTVL